MTSGEIKGSFPFAITQIGAWAQKNAKWVQAIPMLFPMARAMRKLAFGKLSGSSLPQVPFTQFDGTTFRLLIVSPPSWHTDLKPFEPATGHFYFDLWQSAREHYNSEDIHWTQVKGKDDDWISTLIKQIELVSPSHILLHAEENPTGDPRDLANLASALSQGFKGWVTLLMYDSVYWNHLLIAEEFAQLYPRTNVIATDGELKLLRGLSKAGPALLPTSKQSLRMLEERYENDHREQPTFDISHIGSLYGYRLKKITKLKQLGLDVVLNPHRINPSEVPEYYEFYRAFRNSKFTLNFSRANGANVKHAKTRILEASLFGSILVTDENRLTKQLLDPEAFVYFKSLRQLQQRLSNPQNDPKLESILTLRSKSETSAENCREIFWNVYSNLNALDKPT